MRKVGGRNGGRALTFTGAVLGLLIVPPPDRPTAESLDALALRLAGMTAVTGFEQAMGDSLLALLPGATRDPTGDVTLTLGRGTPRRLAHCAFDEPGYVVGAVTPDGYLTLRRVGRVTDRLFDQQIEGHRVTVFGDRGPVPGVVGVRSIHLARGRGGEDPPFTVDQAYVDVGAASVPEVAALGVHLLSPVAMTRQPQRYGPDLLAAPGAGSRAACAALLAAARARPRVRGTVVVAFTTQHLLGPRGGAGLATVVARQGPFSEVREATLPVRFAASPVETVSLGAARALADDLTRWMERAP